MSRLKELKSKLRSGKVYRRSDLSEWSNAVDRHLKELLKEGVLEKLSQGLYYVPKTSVFGRVPPDEETLVRSFLKDNRFLILTPNSYNSLGLGTTQLYNKKVVYNHKRLGKFKLGNREFEFQIKHHFPSKVSEVFLMVDMVNHIDELAEESDLVLDKLLAKAKQMPRNKLKRTVMEFGNIKTKKIFKHIINS